MVTMATMVKVEEECGGMVEEDTRDETCVYACEGRRNRYNLDIIFEGILL